MSTADIVLDNLTDKNVIYYSVLFIRGRIELKDAKIVNGEIALHHEGVVSWFKVSLGKFKCLVELKLGQNNVKFSYKNEIYYGEKFYCFERRINNRCQNYVKLLYVTASNDTGHFQSFTNKNPPEIACKQIATGFKLLQSFIAEKLNEEGFGRKTFNIEDECQVFKSRHTKELFHKSTSEEIWTYVAKELLECQLINENCKVFAFLSCTEYLEDSGQLKGHVSCGRGHFAMLGSLGLCTWADDIENVMDRLSSRESLSRNIVGFGRTFGECYSSTLGAALHELSHIFDLVHADSGIMARGFEDLDVFFTLNCDNNRQTIKIEGNCGNGVTVRPLSTSKIIQFRSGVQSSTCANVSREGRAFFHRSGSVLLSAHPWFQQPGEPDMEDNGAVQICGLEVRAPNGLRLIELHACDDYLVKFWDFTKNPVKLQRHCLTLFDVKNVPDPSLLVQDSCGNLIRQRVDISF